MKPTTHSTFTELILCSIVCLNVYIVLKKKIWKPLLLLEAHHSVYFYRGHTLCNCMFECINCFWKTASESYCFCLKSTTHCTFKERILCSIVCLNMYNVSMTSSESHCLCLKPNKHCTFTERIFVQLYGLICLMFWKTSSDSHCLCLKPTTQCTSKDAYFVQLYVWMCKLFL